MVSKLHVRCFSVSTSVAVFCRLQWYSLLVLTFQIYGLSLGSGGHLTDYWGPPPRPLVSTTEFRASRISLAESSLFVPCALLSYMYLCSFIILDLLSQYSLHSVFCYTKLCHVKVWLSLLLSKRQNKELKDLVVCQSIIYFTFLYHSFTFY